MRRPLLRTMTPRLTAARLLLSALPMALLTPLPAALVVTLTAPALLRMTLAMLRRTSARWLSRLLFQRRPGRKRRLRTARLRWCGWTCPLRTFRRPFAPLLLHLPALFRCWLRLLRRARGLQRRRTDLLARRGRRERTRRPESRRPEMMPRRPLRKTHPPRSRWQPHHGRPHAHARRRRREARLPRTRLLSTRGLTRFRLLAALLPAALFALRRRLRLCRLLRLRSALRPCRLLVFKICLFVGLRRRFIPHGIPTPVFQLLALCQPRLGDGRIHCQSKICLCFPLKHLPIRTHHRRSLCRTLRPCTLRRRATSAAAGLGSAPPGPAARTRRP